MNTEIENVQSRSEVVQSEDYQNNLLQEIESEMEAKRAIRGDLDMQVSRFASQNYILSYLSDNTDREGCPIPTEVCCSTHGIDVIYQDKNVTHELEVMQVESGDNDTQEAIDMLTELLEDAKGKEKKEIKEAIEMLREMLPEPEEENEIHYISYLNKDNNFKQTDKEFKGKNSYQDAVKYGKENLPNFNIDMVRMKF